MNKFYSLLKMIQAVAFVTYKEWAAYRSHMLLSLFVGPVFFLSQVFIWKAVFAERKELCGYTIDEMLIYYGVSSIIYYLIMDFADWNLQMLIRTGKFLTYLLRPLPHPIFAFSQKIGHRILGFFFELVPVWLIFFFLFHIHLIPVKPFWAFLSILFSFLIMFLLNYSIGILAFWLTRTDGIRALIRLFRDLLAGVFIPLSFFPQPVQKVLFFLPFQFITYVPTKVFMGSYDLAGWKISIPEIIELQGVMLILMLLFTGILWRFGIKRFTGAGA